MDLLARQYRMTHTAARSLVILLEPFRMVQFTMLFALIIFVLQWLFQPGTFYSIVTNPALSTAEVVDVLIDGFFAVFRFVDDITPITFILIAFFQSTASVLWLELRKIARTQTARTQIFPIGLSLVGSGCVACSGSVFSPLLAAAASELSVAVAQAIGDAVLLVAVLLSARAWRIVALEYAARTRGMST